MGAYWTWRTGATVDPPIEFAKGATFLDKSFFDVQLTRYVAPLMCNIEQSKLPSSVTGLKQTLRTGHMLLLEAPVELNLGATGAALVQLRLLEPSNGAREFGLLDGAH